MNIWRDDEFDRGWFPDGVDLVPNLAVPAIVAIVTLIGLGALVAAVGLAQRSRLRRTR
jgi:hypothetical protein